MSRDTPSRPRDLPRDRDAPGEGRAFRGLALVFALSFLNLAGVLVTATALGGVDPWTGWQFIGMYGAAEAAAGVANVVSPNIWRLPIAELETGRGTKIRLAASTVLIPHWGGLARTAAGLVLVAAVAWHEGVGPATFGLVVLVPALALVFVAVSTLVARAGVARPDLDVLQLVVRWGGTERELRPISLGASVIQFLLTVVTIPTAKLLPTSVLYRPELGPSATALLVVVGASLILSALAYAAWSGRLAIGAPLEQQREAEEHG